MRYHIIKGKAIHFIRKYKFTCCCACILFIMFIIYLVVGSTHLIIKDELVYLSDDTAIPYANFIRKNIVHK
jgi:hypothetical protein